MILATLTCLALSACAGTLNGDVTPQPAESNVVCTYERPTGSKVARRMCCPRGDGRASEMTNFVTYQYALADGRNDDAQRACPVHTQGYF